MDDAIGAAVRQLREAWDEAPKHTCMGCGVRFTGPAAARCWDCEERERHRLLEDERQRRQTAEHIPPAYREATLDGYLCPPGDARARDAVAAWKPKRLCPALLLWSEQTGVGKTHLAMATLRARIAAGRSVWAASVVDLLADLRATFDAPGRSEADVLRQVERADLVLLDDLGAHTPTEWAGEVLFRVIDQRLRDQRAVILTSNVKPTALADRIGGDQGRRLASRIIGASLAVEVQAADYRMRR